MRSFFKFASLPVAIICLTVFSGYALATHPAGGDCGHTHFDRTHGECNKGVENSSCIVNSTAGTCVQTSSNCQCRVVGSAASIQENEIVIIVGLLEDIINAKAAKSGLGRETLGQEMDQLFIQLEEASTALNAQGTTLNNLTDIKVGANLDKIAKNLPAAKRALLSSVTTASATDIKDEITAITTLIRALKASWITNWGT